jgi:hypothetical protein
VEEARADADLVVRSFERATFAGGSPDEAGVGEALDAAERVRTSR